METAFTPAKQKPQPAETEETAATTTEVIHDGSGGAFEGTEQVSEEREERPAKDAPRPY